jgi:hypothetical protein
LPVAIDSAVNTNVFNYTDVGLTNGVQSYYYAEISISGGYVITSPVWYTKTSGPFPVTILSFTAKATAERQVSIDWRTVNEVNNKYFIIERAADGLKFTSIDSVAGKNLAIENYYSSLDKAPLQGMNYYRLKQVDTDGKFTYSNIIAVKIGGTIKGEVLVYPNPAKDVLQLSLNSGTAAEGTISIVDGLGKVQRSVSAHFIAGAQLKNIDVKGLNSGTYYLVINMGNEKLVKQFVKL